MRERIRAVSSSAYARGRELVSTPLGVIFLVYLVLRVITFAGVNVSKFPDSQSWLHLDFSGASTRLWTTPLFFKVLPAMQLREIGQAVLSIIVWTWLATLTARAMAHRVLQPVAFGLVLLLSLVSQITNWDTAILGESTGISLTVALVAAWWMFAFWPSRAATILLCVTSVLWAFQRHVDLTITVIIVVLLIVSLFVAKQERRRRLAVLAVLVVTLGWGLPMIGKNQFNQDEVLITIISERVLTSPSRTQWFADHGMPHGRDVKALAGSFYTLGYGSGPIRHNKKLFHWIRTDGRSTYFQFLVTHPLFTLFAPARDAVGPSAAVLSGAQYALTRDVLPTPIDQLLFGGTGQLVLLVVIAGVLVIFAFGFRRWTFRELVPGIAVVMAAVLYWVTYHGVASEPERHYMVAAAAIRVTLLVISLLAVDALLSRRSARPRGSPGTRTSTATDRAEDARASAASDSRPTAGS